jgi:hypothetical protein
MSADYAYDLRSTRQNKNQTEDSMRTRQARTRTDRRVPLTIMLEPSMLAFIEQCAQTRRFRSVDAFFDSALNVFRKHVEALDTYIQLEQAKGHSLEEIVSSTQCEIVVTRQLDSA